MNDLSRSNDHQKIFDDDAKTVTTKLAAMPDLSFYPEPYLLEHAIENLVAFGQRNHNEIKELIAIADLNLLSFDSAQVKNKTSPYQ